jgi:sigma-B regulation protein RsbU (phosphoserine phosphatase)
MTSREMFKDIELRFGFIPPFFEPAAETPDVLQNLWQQTLSAYFDNPLPPLFKEKVSAYLSRHCSASYCLVCHSCSLMPLGMTGNQILNLLVSPIPEPEQVRAAIQRLRTAPGRGVELLAAGSPSEEAVIVLAGVIYLGSPYARDAQLALRETLGTADRDRLISLIHYLKACHGWVESHPEISVQVDERYRKNFEPLVEQEPSLRPYFDEYVSKFGAHQARRAPTPAPINVSVTGNVQSRVDEAGETIAMLESRIFAVMEERKQAADFAQELVTIAGHDLRNPLAAILGSATLLLRTAGGDDRVLRFATRIVNSCQRANRLVGDLLDFAQARVGGGIPVRPAPCDVHTLTKDGVDEMRAAHPERQLEVEASGPGQGAWDAERVSQLLANLLGNAVAHSPEGSVIRVRSSGTPEEVVLSVHNQTGEAPIPAEKLATLFEPYRRGARHSKTKSIGLGLYIARNVARAHGGELSARSDADGITFEARLPRWVTAGTVDRRSPAPALPS